MAEFSDCPVTPPPIQEQYHGFFPAKYITAYLESYVDEHFYSGLSLRQRIRFSARVQSISQNDEAIWSVGIVECRSDRQYEIFARKLIDAAGLTSKPAPAHLSGHDDFAVLTLHQKSFGEHERSILHVDGLKNITILGGAKSAADVVYACASAPKTYGKVISWVIREDGNGPAAFLGAEGKLGYANSNDSFYTRFTARFLPNVFTSEPSWIQSSRIGRWMQRLIWSRIDQMYRRRVDFEGKGCAQRQRRLSGDGFDALKPDNSIFWQNDSAGINQHADFWDVIASRVHVYRQNVDRVERESLVLMPRSDAIDRKETTIPAEVIIHCTGWDPICDYMATSEAERLGLPIPVIHANTKHQSHWTRLEGLEDLKVLKDLPILADPPIYRDINSAFTPFRLYQSMVPVHDVAKRSLIFLGRAVLGNNFRAAEIQALWAMAYLESKIDCGTIEDMERSVARTVAWSRRRYLNKGKLGNYMFFDVLPYTDRLLAQLGLTSHRKKGWLRDLFGPCRAADLGGLLDEYKVRYRFPI